MSALMPRRGQEFGPHSGFGITQRALELSLLPGPFQVEAE
jgi:hypothetical protein